MIVVQVGLFLLVVAGSVACAIKAIDGDGWPWGVASFLLLVLVCSVVGYSATREDEGGGVHSWKGGDGPRTVCWYAEKDNPDTYVKSGDVMVPIDGGSSLYTYCGPRSAAPEGAGS